MLAKHRSGTPFTAFIAHGLPIFGDFSSSHSHPLLPAQSHTPASGDQFRGGTPFSVIAVWYNDSKIIRPVSFYFQLLEARQLSQGVSEGCRIVIHQGEKTTYHAAFDEPCTRAANLDRRSDTPGPVRAWNRLIDVRTPVD